MVILAATRLVPIYTVEVINGKLVPCYDFFTHNIAKEFKCNKQGIDIAFDLSKQGYSVSLQIENK